MICRLWHGWTAPANALRLDPTRRGSLTTRNMARKPRPTCSMMRAGVATWLLLPVVTLRAQQPASLQPAARAASRAIEARLSYTQLRRLRCVNAAFANCDGGLEIVQGFTLGDGHSHGDTAQFPVAFTVLGVVASSEAELMFMPAHQANAVDSGTVTMIRRGGGWSFRSMTMEQSRSLTSAAAARRFFELPEEDHQALDSAITAHPRVH